MKTELYWIDHSWAGRLAIAPRPRGGDWLEDETRAWQRAGVDVVVSLLTEDEVAEFDLSREAELCELHGITFLSLPIEDRSVPNSQNVTADFINRLARALAEGKGIVMHCRQGIGRSALIAAALLTMSGIPSEAAFAHISAARGCSVPETAQQRGWVAEFAREHALPLSKR